MIFLKILRKREKMSKIFTVFVGLFLWGVLSGCRTPGLPEAQEGVFVVWKTPVMRYADQGFLYRGKDRIRLEIYANGQAVMRLSVTPTQICSGALCTDPQTFNLRYLSPHYPKTFLIHLLAGEPIFGGEGKVESKEEWLQEIHRAGEYDIHYRVSKNSIDFRDTINTIVIKINKEK